MAADATSLWFETALLPQGWADRVRILVEEGRITSVQPAVDASPADERAGVGLPGLSNLHSHAFQRGMAGLAETRGPNDDGFWTWREVVYRFLERLTPEDVEAIAAQAYVEMLEGGFTRVGEFHYLHHQADGRPYADLAEMSTRIAAAADETGIGLTLLPVFYAHGGFGGVPPEPAQRRFLNDVDRFGRLLEAACGCIGRLDDALVGVAPHSLRAVTPKELAVVAAMVPGAPIHIHVAEQVREVENCIAWSGQRPVQWLLDHVDLDEHWCLVHATHVTATETRQLARRRAVVGLCPVTEANLGDGLFPAAAFLQEGGSFGVGSDSNVHIDAAEELRLLEYGQRLHLRARNVLAVLPGHSTGGVLFRHALEGGARALGVCGGLQPGACADIVALDPSHPALVARTKDALLDSWIFGVAQGAITSVWRRGRKVVADGRHLRRDAVAERFRRVMKGLLGT